MTIPRPCIDMQNVGYNVEWSQELTLDESLDEYVKAAMLIEILAASGRLPLAPGFDRTVFDLSVGYDLAGITGERVPAFIDGLMDATATVERLRREIPAELGAFARPADFRDRALRHAHALDLPRLPAREIERIVRYLQRRARPALHRQAQPDAARRRRRSAASSTTCSATTRSACRRRPSSATRAGRR